ncbi:major facilitator superfamily domain-containing protein [Catenaria anguillulae PL171]|uniref:Major facilitator superfamily domain-containing protein n=1 Tax=Catenaria anguillulae PL171 TaxID=765915 RepID=A0A1Y2H7A6_9FUNG|nr:major facilitator superfamily domain-containing protein [Catenaria anguillulae PL171]
MSSSTCLPPHVEPSLAPPTANNGPQLERVHSAEASTSNKFCSLITPLHQHQMCDMDSTNDLDDDHLHPPPTRATLPHHHHLPATPLRLFTLTVALLGLQLAWAVELAYGTPYLLSLGMSKAWTSLVWLAGPLSGLLVQPIVGALSDASTLKMGRRRPFLMLGTAASLLAMGLVALSRPIGGSTATHITNWTILVAVVGFYLLDFAVNTVQAASRALIVDVMHPKDQAVANAVAGAMVCLGNVIGYAAGLVDWPRVVGIPATPAAQFQLVCSVASVALVCAVAVTVVCTPEMPNKKTALHHQGAESGDAKGWVHVLVGPLVTVAKAIPNMPQVAVNVCLIQILCWLGWFPFLFYSTTWVAQYSTNSHFPFDGPDAAHATRQGSLAFFSFSLVALLIAMVLPSLTRRFALRLPHVWMAGESLFALTMTLGTLCVSASNKSASLVITLTGIAWAVGMWVPMAMLGEVVSQAATACPAASDTGDADGHGVPGMARAVSSSGLGVQRGWAKRMRSMSGTSMEYQAVGIEDEDASRVVDMSVSSSSTTLLGGGLTRSQSVSDFRRATKPLASIEPFSMRTHAPDSTAPLEACVPAAGIVLGLHNVSIVLPQLLVSVLAAFLFAVLPDGKGRPMVPGAKDDAIGWLFRMGGVAAAVGVWLIWKLVGREDHDGDEEQVG